jgi:hypothetical protein
VKIEPIPLNVDGKAPPVTPVAERRVVDVPIQQPEDEESALEGLSGVDKVIRLFDIRLWRTLWSQIQKVKPRAIEVTEHRRHVEALREHYTILTSRHIDAEDWLCDIVRVTSRKDVDKQNLDYMIGTIRHWLRLGKFNMPSQEQDDIAKGFEDETGCEPSVDCHAVLFELMAKYGATRVALNLGKFMRGGKPDLSLVYALQFKSFMEENVSTVEESNKHRSGTARAAR